MKKQSEAFLDSNNCKTHWKRIQKSAIYSKTVKRVVDIFKTSTD